MSKTMCELDHTNYDINLFDIDIGSVEKRTFIDSKTKQETSYFTGRLTYNGSEPCIIVRGPSYGVQKSTRKGEDGDEPEAPQGMVQLPSAPAKNESGELRKEKWQIGVKLSKEPAQKDWTPAEAKLISFFDVEIRMILAHVLAKKIEILNKIGSGAIPDTQQKFAQEMQNPATAGKYTNEAAQMERFKAILADTLVSKISRKVYRKKKEVKEGAQLNFLDSSAQYDETKYPTLYASMMNYISKKTKTEEFATQYFQFVEGTDEVNWPKLTHAEAVNLGWYDVQAVIPFGDIYFGSSISAQLKVSEIVFMKAIENTAGRRPRLIKAAEDVPRNPRLIQRSAIQPAQPGNRIEAGEKGKEEATAPVPQQIVAPAPVAFNPGSLGNIPGIGALQMPTVVSAHGIANSNN